MSKKQTLQSLSKTEIRESLEAGETFQIPNDRQRRDVLVAASFLGIRVTTRKSELGYEVAFVK